MSLSEAMGTRVILAILFLTLLLGFQNCAKVSSTDSAGDSQQKSQTVIGSTSQYKKISYDNHLHLEVIPNPTLDIDIQTGSITASQNGVTKTCSLDTSRLREARSILANSSVCAPGSLPAGMVSCMSFAQPDITLSNDTDSINLSPLTCNTGLFLCDGNDDQLRSLIADLIANPPVGCN